MFTWLDQFVRDLPVRYSQPRLCPQRCGAGGRLIGVRDRRQHRDVQRGARLDYRSVSI